MCVVKNMDEFEIMPQVKMPFFTASDDVSVELLYADVPSTRLRVKIMIY
jgi:hypothetical protein